MEIQAMRFAKLPKQFVQDLTISANLVALINAKPETISRHRALAAVSLVLLALSVVLFATANGTKITATLAMLAIIAMIFLWDSLTYVVFQLNLARGKLRNFYALAYLFGFAGVLFGYSGRPAIALIFLVLLMTPTVVTLGRALIDPKSSFLNDQFVSYMLQEYKRRIKKDNSQGAH
jgi:hypothetical protein